MSKKTLVFSVLFMLLAGQMMATSMDSFDRMQLNQWQAAATKACANNPGKPVTPKKIDRYASQMMLVKDGMSFYRDDLLNSNQETLLRRLIQQHYDFSRSAIDTDIPSRSRTLANLIFSNAIEAKRIMKMERNSRAFESAMGEYHRGLGYTSFCRAQDLGVDQIKK